MGDMTDNRVTNAVLGQKLDGVSDKIDDLCVRYGVTHDQVIVNTAHLRMLELRPVVVCPRHETLVEQIQQLQLQIARSSMTGGASGGVVVSIVAGVIFGVGKAAGWW